LVRDVQQQNYVTLPQQRSLEFTQSLINNAMKTKVNVLILMLVVATVISSACGASRKAGCDAYGCTKTEIRSNDLAGK